MFENLKKQLYLTRARLLFDKGLQEGKIVPFDEEFYEKMSNTFFNCIPISIHIKYLEHPGKCYDKSLLMFLCFDDALLVYGETKPIELEHGKDEAGHRWIEIDDYVYDPILKKRFDKCLYYKIMKPKNIYKSTIDDYKDGPFYNNIRNTKISDYQPGGSKRTDLINGIAFVRGIAYLSQNEKFIKELNDYLELIEYDEKQIMEEINSELEKIKLKVLEGSYEL